MENDGHSMAMFALRSHLVRVLTPGLRHLAARPLHIVTLPPFTAESLKDGTVAGLEKSVGQSVEADEPVINIDTDKVNVVVCSDRPGTIVQFFVKEEDIVRPGDRLFSVALKFPIP